MKSHRFFTMVLALAGACHRVQTGYATTEGVYDPGAPTQLRPARALSPTLRDRRVGALAVHLEDMFDTRPGPFELELYADAAWRTHVRTDTIVHEGIFYVGDLGQGVYWGRVRRLGFNQRMFRVQITPGYVDTLDVHLGSSR